MDEVGIRELRNQVAAVVRRASGGERVVITVDGVPVAQLGPLQPDGAGVTLADLAAAGLITAPHRRGVPPPPPVHQPPVDVRVDRALDEVRGR